jgi:hypothetical protein
MKYKVKLSVKIMLFSCLLLANAASATDSVSKTLYIDGAEVATSTVNSAISYPFTRLTIGAEGSAWHRYNEFDGQIDEFAVYDVVLTDAQILAHKNAAVGDYEDVVLADSPLLYLRFEDANSDNNSVAFNSGIADVNGRYIDSVTLSAGYDGNAAEFSGPVTVPEDANGDCVDVPDEYLYLNQDNITVEFWVNTTQATEYPRFFQHNNGDANMGGYGAMYSAADDAVGLIGGGDTDYFTVTPGALNDGSWHHVVVTFRSLRPVSYEAEVLADDPCLYLKFDNLTAPDSSVNHYYVWYRAANNPTSNLHPGKIRPVAGAIGGRALYCDNSSPIDGQYTNVITWNNYAGDQWRNFPGWSDLRGDYYALTEPNYDDFPKESSDITFELWLKSTPELDPCDWCAIFQQIGAAWTYEPRAPLLGLVDGTQFRIAGGSEMWYPGVAPLDGEWHQIVVTYDENEMNLGHDMGIQLYIDGSLANQVTIVDAVTYQALLGPEFYTLVIGADNNVGWASNPFGGWIDEFAVYSGVLSPERIAMHYAAWQPKDCAEVWARGLGYEGDFDKDCDVDLYDYALFAQGWAQCNDPVNCP